jgi:DHA3 family multidrug efflux protein-like MFS transporter
MKAFYQLAANSFFAGLTTMLVWFALSLWVYTQTQSVLATSIMSGIYLVASAVTGVWFGSLVDHHKKKTMMLLSSSITLIAFIVAFAMYRYFPDETFTRDSSFGLWAFVGTVFVGVVVGNIRNITMPTVVGLMVPEDKRDNANGLIGTLMGIVFLLSSVISGFLLASSGMFWIFLMTIGLNLVAIGHLFLIKIPEKKIVAVDTPEEKAAKYNMLETFQSIKDIPGLLPLILFTSFNNFLGGVFMPLLDPYGLSLVTLEQWGVIWGFLSLGFIVGGVIITKKGLGKNPLRTMLLINVILWIDCILFTIQPSIWLLFAGMFLYLSLVPFVEASEHTIIQKVVEPQRQGRVFGFAHSVESAASPLTAFAIGPIAQYVFIPFMREGGTGARLIGSWFGVGDGRGIALVFITAGITGLIMTILALRSHAYKLLSKQYAK